MLTTPTISSTPLHHARFHARPPGGVEPQLAPALERAVRDQERETDRPRLRRVDAPRSAEQSRIGGRGAAQARPQSQAAGRAATAGSPAAADAAGEPLASPAEAAGFSPEELAVLAELAARDRKVRAHETAHARVGGRHAGQPRYEFAVGPDGKRYAIGGQVQIDVSTSPQDPAATIAKMQVVRAAALAPADPSPADRRVAQLAERLMRAAQADLHAMSEMARAEQTGPETARLARLTALFMQTVVLPAPDPVHDRAA
ncbi:putative metalloprotease CJM1_0395 family protein [Paralimibaculum aggregatum]|nr:putative metalloprotease CJM1_0395 family protein [Limibaculum sp. NKW23]